MIIFFYLMCPANCKNAYFCCISSVKQRFIKLKKGQIYLSGPGKHSFKLSQTKIRIQMAFKTSVKKVLHFCSLCLDITFI